MDEMTMRQIFAEEIRARGGPEDYVNRLLNKWQEVDNELPPELSSAIAAMKRVAAGEGPRMTTLPEVLSANEPSDTHSF